MRMVLADDAEYAQSAEHLQRALASNAADVQARLKLAVCLLELGRTAEALGLVGPTMIEGADRPLELRVCAASGQVRFARKSTHVDRHELQVRSARMNASGIRSTIYDASAPFRKFRDTSQHPPTRTSEAKGHQQAL
ncbi:MAG: tetratricopeptide repeat protein, partial [Xanthobacteraceae bacterium]